MSTVQVSPESLRDAGEALYHTRMDDLVDSGQVGMLHGYGTSDAFVSLGGFPMGVECQHRVTELYGDMVRAYDRIYQDLLALSSALYIVADVYHGGDLDQAFEFAFLVPGAEVPPGLPDHVDPDRNSATFLAERREYEAIFGDGPIPTEWREVTTTTTVNGGVVIVTKIYDENDNLIAVRTNQTGGYGTSIVTERYDRDGNLLEKQDYERLPSGATVTTTYDPDGKKTGKVEYTPGEHGGGTTAHYELATDADGNQQLVVVREDNHRVSPAYDSSGVQTGDYTSTYTTTNYSYENGNRSSDTEVLYAVGGQPQAPSLGDANTRAMEQSMAPMNDDLLDDEVYQTRHNDIMTDIERNDYVEVGDYGEVPYEYGVDNPVLVGDGGDKVYRLKDPEWLEAEREKGRLTDVPLPAPPD